ncbi:MAG: hypothetical protein RSC20_01255 [Clostridiales bacterium]
MLKNTLYYFYDFAYDIDNAIKKRYHMSKVCCIIPAEEDVSDGVSNDEIFRVIARITHDFGIDSFIIGTNLGMEQNILEYLIFSRNTAKKFTITGVIGAEEAATIWSETQRNRFFSLVACCDYELLLHPMHSDLAEFYKNLVIVDLADLIFIIGKDENLEYWVKKRNKKLLKFDLEDKVLVPNITLLS